MAAGQALLNGSLVHVQPIQGGVQLALVDLGQIEIFNQSTQRGFLSEATGRRKLGRRLQEPCHDHRHYQVTLGTALGVKVAVEADLAQSAEDGSDVPEGLTADHLEALREVFDDSTATKESSQPLDSLRG